MREHAFDGEMGLAGVGRSEHGGDAAPAMAICGIRGEGPAHLLTFSSSNPRKTRNTGGTNLVRIADSAHSDFVPKGIRGSGSLFQSTWPAHFGVAMTTKSGLSLSLLSQAPRKTKGTKGGRIRGALIFGICSLQHIGIMGLCVNPQAFRSLKRQTATARRWRGMSLQPGSRSPGPCHILPASATQSGRAHT